MSDPLRWFCGAMGAIGFGMAGWFVTNPVGEFNWLVVSFAAVGGVIGLWGAIRG